MLRASGLPLLSLVLAATCSCGRRPTGGDPGEPPAGVAELQAIAPTTGRTIQTKSACTDDAWTTYGHDAARTSASGGCLFAPLHAGWSFSPRWVKGTPSHAARAVVEGDAIYVSGGIGPTPTVWKLDAATGAIAWTFVSMADASRDGWPTVAGDKLLLVDDGVYAVDAATGKGHRGELDAWGESLTDGMRLYAENDRYWDGYGLSVSAYDLDARMLWRRDYDALIRFYSAPDLGGLALDGGRLVHASQHGPLRTTGLSAFDPVTSERLWRVDVSPQSSPSIADGRVFAIERWKAEDTDRLVARSLQDGSLTWSQPLQDARGPAPLLASGLVVVHARGGVHAFRRDSGEAAWSAALARTADTNQSATSLAAAAGSGSLVVLSGGAVHLLRLADGGEIWTGEPFPGAKRIEGPVVAGDALYLVVDGALHKLEGSSAR